MPKQFDYIDFQTRTEIGIRGKLVLLVFILIGVCETSRIYIDFDK